MAPLAGGEGGRFQARRQVATEHQESENGSDGSTWKPSTPAVFVGRFLPYKVSDLLSLYGWPIHVSGAKTGRQETPGQTPIVMTSAGGEATDLIQVLLVSKQPVVGLRTRRVLDALGQTQFLAPELEQMGQPLGIFGQLTARRSRQCADVAVDECLTDI